MAIFQESALLTELENDTITREQIENLCIRDVQSPHGENLRRIFDLLRDRHLIAFVEAVELTNNNLIFLPDGLFQGMNVVSDIDLSRNQLTTLPPTLFNGLSNLEFLGLEFNALRNLPEELFQNLSGLHYLNLSENQLIDFPEGLFNGLRLEMFHICNNYELREDGTLVQLTLPKHIRAHVKFDIDSTGIYKHIMRCHAENLNIIHLSLWENPNWPHDFSDEQRNNLERTDPILRETRREIEVLPSSLGFIEAFVPIVCQYLGFLNAIPQSDTYEEECLIKEQIEAESSANHSIEDAAQLPSSPRGPQ